IPSRTTKTGETANAIKLSTVTPIGRLREPTGMPLPRNNRSGEEATDEGGFGDAADGEDHGAGAGRDVVLAHGVDHLVEGAHDDLLQARVDFVDVPHQAFLVLYPFEIADGDATGVGKNVRQNGDTAARENFVGVGGGGAVGGDRKSTRLNS